MTLRALLVGLIGAIFIAGFGYVNDHVLGLESFNGGHLLPVIVFGTLVLVLAVVNPLLFRVHRKLVFRPAEAAVVLTMALVACSIPGRGLMEQFTQTLAMPRHWVRMTPGWKGRLERYMPEGAYPAQSPTDPETLGGYLGGKSDGKKWIGAGDVPWGLWRRALVTWIPLLVLSAGAVVCLAVILHQQWSVNERLRYPIADFASSLLDRKGDEATGQVFRQRTFWVGLAIVVAIRGINGLNVWMEGQSISIPTCLDFSALGQRFPIFYETLSGWQLLYVNLFPIVIAFSFFLTSEISLTLGVSEPIYMLVSAALIGAGVSMKTDYELGGPEGWQRAGSYVAMGLMLLYVGRQHYGAVARAGLTGRKSQHVGAGSAWAFRTFLACTVGMIVLITRLGLDWPLSIALVLLVLLTFVIVSRISAETGLFFIQPGLQACGVLMGLFGSYALGPGAIFVMGLVCMVLCADQSQALMPYVVNALRLGSNQQLRPGKVGGLSIGTYAISLAVAVPVVLWACYNFGTTQGGYMFWRIPTVPMRATSDAVVELGDRINTSERLTAFERLENMRPKAGFLWSAGAGFGLVLAFSLLRLRFSWWPLHPVMFLVWATWPLQAFGPSFLIGWMVKAAVTRFGGTRLYRRCVPFMIGMVAGEVLSGILFMGLGAGYFAVTGLKPPRYTFFPR
jgi:hypothetical protein